MASAQINEVVGWLAHARHTVALTGAGISTESGIPDFRGPQGVWTTNPKAEALSDIRYYVADPESAGARGSAGWTTRRAARRRTPGHRAIVELERMGRLQLLITQNIDGLHLAAGSSRERLIEIHGSMRDVRLPVCGASGPMTEPSTACAPARTIRPAWTAAAS